METHRLICHPETPCDAVEAITVQVARGAERLHLSYRLAGDVGALVVPQPRRPGRAHDLWRTTCFEAFLMPGQGGYAEFNLSPSSRWAAYAFTDYRDGMDDLALEGEPGIGLDWSYDDLLLDAQLPLPEWLRGEVQAGLSAVIEERSGARSYWALTHTPGRPDFHHPDCFALQLAAVA